MNKPFWPAILLAALGWLVPAVARADTPLPDAIEFNRDVRPILSDNCYACHGPDKNKREAELRLDTKDGLLGEIGDPADVAAGQLDDCELLRRITTDDPDDHMPPPDSGKALGPREIALIRRWIEQGAKWEGHWAFNPIKRPAQPPADDPAFVKNPIDAFVLEKLREHNLRHAAEADRVTLIRRLSFDLVGLPPAPEQVDRFVNDADTNAYERLVDQLLASPHFGERMAMFWLDLVRYADSVGYHGDQPINTYPFRDYVIDSFNRGKPFDQFTIEQLGGDLLPEASPEMKIAAGYNRLNMMSAEGGGQDKEYLAKYASDRVRATSVAWMGATLGCAECHDHKFDPYTTKDFYRFAAFFADVTERGIYGGSEGNGAWGPMLAVPTAEQAAQSQRLDGELAAAQKTFEQSAPEIAAAQAEWEKQTPAWIVLAPESVASANGVTLTVQPDHSVLAAGANPETDTYTLTFKDPPPGVTALRVEVLPHDSLPQKGPGRSGNGNFVLTEFVAKFKPPGEAAEQPIALQNATATFEQKAGGDQTPYGAWTAAGAIDGDVKGTEFGWAVAEQPGKPNHAVFETAADLAGGDGTTLTLVLMQNHGRGNHTLGHFRLSATTAPRPVKAGATPPDNIAAILAIASAKRNDAQKNELAAYYRGIAPQLEPQRQQIAQLQAAKDALDKAITKTPTTVAGAPREMRILPRGNWMSDAGEVVAPGVPAFLVQPPAKEGTLNRLDLGRWIASPENPLPARVFVNRLWRMYFGAGLSKRLDDLGAQGDWPSHPLLVDWLAGQFIDSGWDVKRTIKLMVMSGTYRQSSQAAPDLREQDPYNRWLARQSRFRLDAELVRDNALAISGLLVDRVGGPSVKPYQPPGYWAYLNFPAREWQNGTGDELYRRGLYTHWQRQYLHPSLLAFDAPTREECAAERPRSNTPLQSLVLLNDPSFVEAARAFAERAIREGGATFDERLNWAFRRAVARGAKPEEQTVLAALYEKHLAEYKADAAAANQFLATGSHPAPQGMDPAELAALTSVTRTILNLHKTITRD